jgi:hypothetical protein
MMNLLMKKPTRLSKQSGRACSAVGGKGREGRTQPSRKIGKCLTNKRNGEQLKHELNAENVKELLDYDPETGDHVGVTRVATVPAISFV